MAQNRIHDLTLAQVRALSSPIRQAILQVLGGMGRGSAAELTEALGVTRSGLYYHLDNLRGAGLILEEGIRSATTRPERVFSLTHRRVRIGRSRTKSYRAAVSKMLDASIRALGKRLAQVVSDKSTSGQYSVRRVRVRLTKEKLGRFHESAKRLVDQVTSDSNDARGRWQEISIFQVPVD